MDNVVVYYQAWQMQCCGEPFVKGDIVTWEVFIATDSLEDGNPIIMPELYEWQKEIEPMVVAFSVGEPYDKDWADYHRRGLYIAHKLRQVLSPDFDLWYEAPLEDRSRTIPQMLLISQSKNVLICENILGELEIITNPNKIKRIQDDQEKREWVTLPSGIKVGLLTDEEKTKLKERGKSKNESQVFGRVERSEGEPLSPTSTKAGEVTKISG